MKFSSCNMERSNWRGWFAVLGGFLIHLTLGTVYTFGNMTTYMTSYIRAYSTPDTLTYGESVWCLALTFAAQGASMFLGGIIMMKIGPRWTALIGGWLMSVGVFLTYFTVQRSFYITLVTYSVVFGAGVGIAYVPPLTCAMKWLPNHKGLVNGIVLAGFGGGAFVFNQIQTFFINPQNKIPDLIDPPDSKERYFSKTDSTDILKNVPGCFLLLGACYAGLQLIGALLLVDPPKEPTPEQGIEEDLLLSGGNEEGNPDMGGSSDDMVSWHPKDVVRSRPFVTIWLMFLLNGQSVIFISSLYKAFGQTFIHDDHFLAILGSIASVANALGRILWGLFADRHSFKAAMLTLCSSMSVFMLTFIATQYGGEIMFSVWVVILFLIFSGSYALFPTVIAKAFGPKYTAVNYGLVFTSQVVTGIIGAVLSSSLTDLLGWFAMFCLIATFSFLSLLLTFTFNLKGRDGSNI